MSIHTPPLNTTPGRLTRRLARIALSAVLALCLASCSDHTPPIEVEKSKTRTDGWLNEIGWVETERRAVGDRVYIKSETATEIRWVEVHGLRSRVMGREEVVPK